MWTQRNGNLPCRQIILASNSPRRRAARRAVGSGAGGSGLALARASARAEGRVIRSCSETFSRVAAGSPASPAAARAAFRIWSQKYKRSRSRGPRSSAGAAPKTVSRSAAARSIEARKSPAAYRFHRAAFSARVLASACPSRLDRHHWGFSIRASNRSISRAVILPSASARRRKSSKGSSTSVRDFSVRRIAMDRPYRASDGLGAKECDECAVAEIVLSR